MSDGMQERRAFLRRVIVAEMANERLERLAVATFPADLYLQSVMVTGIDPLLGMDDDDGQEK